MASKVMHTGRDGGWRRSLAGFVAPSCPLTVIVCCDRILYAPTIKHWMSFRGKWFYYGWLFSFQLLVHGLLEVNTFHVIQCNWWWMKSWIEGNFFGHFLVFSGLIMVFLQVYQLRSKRVYSLRRGVKKECDVSLCSIWSSGLMMVLVLSDSWQKVSFFTYKVYQTPRPPKFLCFLDNLSFQRKRVSLSGQHACIAMRNENGKNWLYFSKWTDENVIGWVTFQLFKILA
jgi:hypothetical protein